MEEKKSKTVKMQPVKGTAAQNESRKLTYEQLNDACNQLFQQNQQLYKKVNELNTYNAFKRLEYLFKVLDSYYAADKVTEITFDPAFVESCIKEIQEAMTVKEEEKPEEEAKE